jgi:hypothetical protein
MRRIPKQLRHVWSGPGQLTCCIHCGDLRRLLKPMRKIGGMCPARDRRKGERRRNGK